MPPPPASSSSERLLSGSLDLEALDLEEDALILRSAFFIALRVGREELGGADSRFTPRDSQLGSARSSRRSRETISLGNLTNFAAQRRLWLVLGLDVDEREILVRLSSGGIAG